MRYFKIFAVGLLACLSNLAAAAYQHAYTGAPFDTFDGPTFVGGAVIGSFTTAGPLPPNLSNASILPLVTSWSFSDGSTLGALTNGNSTIASGGTFSVSTDGAGNVTTARINLITPGPHTVGNSYHSIEIDDVLGPRSLGYYAECTVLDAGLLCSSLDPTLVPGEPNGYGAVDAAGVWVTSLQTVPTATAVAVPTISTPVLLLLLSMALAAVCYQQQRRRS